MLALLLFARPLVFINCVVAIEMEQLEKYASASAVG